MKTDRSASDVVRVAVAIGLGLVGGLVRAQNGSFEQQRDALQSEWSAQRKQQGLTDGTALYAKYPTPQLALDPKPIIVQPGTSAGFTMRGKFQNGTAFLAENDGVTLAGGLSGGAYAGKIVVDPNRFPGFIRVWAFTPVSGASNAAPVAFVNSVLGFTLEAPNGWTIRMTPTDKSFIVDSNEATLPYRVEFLRANEAKPFEVRQSTLRLSINDIDEPLSFTLGPVANSAQAELEQLTRTLSDPNGFMKMTEAQQNALMERLQELSERMMDEQMTMLKTDPAVLQKQQDDFGCSSIYISPAGAGKVTARMGCGRNVGQSGSLNLTGTAAIVR